MDEKGNKDKLLSKCALFLKTVLAYVGRAWSIEIPLEKFQVQFYNVKQKASILILKHISSSATIQNLFFLILPKVLFFIPRLKYKI